MHGRARMSNTLLVSSTSPFHISSEHVDQLNSNPSFRALRLQLADVAQYRCHRFCHSHDRTIEPHEKEVFRLHRDIIHAAFVPTLQLLGDASRTAAEVLPNRPTADLELAFRNDARSAFTWLQSSIAEEGDWCRTKGCPACIVLRAFHSEHLIRLFAVVCRTCESLTNCDVARPESRLPSFSFMLEALRVGVQQDHFWGPSCWAVVDDKSSRMAANIQQLAAQTRHSQRRLQLTEDGLIAVSDTSASWAQAQERTLPAILMQYGTRHCNDATGWFRVPRSRASKLPTSTYSCSYEIKGVI